MTLPGAKVLLAGTPGSGKSTAIRTALDAGLSVFAIVNESHSCAILQRDPRLHFAYVPTASGNWKSLMDTARLVNTLSAGKLQEMTPGRTNQGQFLRVLELCNNATCDRCGRSFGDITNLGPEWLVAIDSLSGLSTQARALTVGDKPGPTQPEWGIMMSVLEKVIQTLTDNLRCHFVLTAHLENERDELTGAIKNMVSTLGRKLAPVLPAKFSDVIRAEYSGTQFKWLTVHNNMDLKATYVPNGRNDLEPSFVPLIKRWRELAIDGDVVRKGSPLEIQPDLCQPKA